MKLVKLSVAISSVFVTLTFVCNNNSNAFTTRRISQQKCCIECNSRKLKLKGWFDSLFPSAVDNDGGSAQQRQIVYPEQYPATMELSTITISTDSDDAKRVRPLLKGTQLESRELTVAYDASIHGWDAYSFHKAVDGKGASIILCESTEEPYVFGGYNPKGWSSNGGARPSVAAFLWYQKTKQDDALLLLQKLEKVGGGGLACAKDDPSTGIWLGADGLIIPLSGDNDKGRRAQSKLGTYYSRGPEQLSSLFPSGTCQLSSLKILVGVYEPGEDIPYSGAVMDMTSG